MKFVIISWNSEDGKYGTTMKINIKDDEKELEKQIKLFINFIKKHYNV